MELRNGRHIDGRAKGPVGSGSQGFVFWVASQFDPPTYLVRGDDIADAWANFICCDQFTRFFRVDPEQVVREYGGLWSGPQDPEGLLESALDWGVLAWNDSGELVDVESVDCETLERFAR